jgi:hypothetical protein
MITGSPFAIIESEIRVAHTPKMQRGPVTWLILMEGKGHIRGVK